MSLDRHVIVMIDTWTSGLPGTPELRILTRAATDSCKLFDWNGDGIMSIVGDVTAFIQCCYFGDCPAGFTCVCDCNHDGICSIIGDVPCFVDCVYFGNCP